MKNLTLILALFSSTVLFADAWDNMSHSQAKSVVHFLKKNPFIIDWCDCCGSDEPAYLIKVDSARIVPCSWDKKQFSVLTHGKRITKFENANIGLDDYHTELLNQEVSYTIFMNYTFVFDSRMKWAVPFYKLIDYSLDGPICFGATNYPNPEDVGVQIEDRDYLRWYAQEIAK